MTLHAEVIVFCNDSIWLVGGKGARRGLEGKHFSKSAACRTWVIWLGRDTLDGQCRIWSPLELAEQGCLVWVQGGDTAWLFLAAEVGLRRQRGWTHHGAATTRVGGQQGWAPHGALPTCTSPYSVSPSTQPPPHRHRASGCALRLLHPRGEWQKYSGAWGFYLVLLSQKIHLHLQT